MKFCPNPRKIAAVCVWRKGWDSDTFAPEYISRWAKGIKENTIIAKPDLFCLTDSADLIVPGLTSLPLISALQSWHSKFEIFRDDLFASYDQVFYFDLDCIITGNLDGIFAADTDFAMLRDFFYPKTLNSSLISFRPGSWQWLYDEAVNLNPESTVGDQGLIEKWVKKYHSIDVWQDYFTLPSYKADYLKNPNKLPGQIMFFHGHPRPHELDWQIKVVKPNFIKQRQPGPVQVVAKRLTYEIPERIYEGKRIFIVGGGPSIRGIDFDSYLMNESVLAINDSYQFKCCKTLFFGDEKWWLYHQNNLDKWQGEIWTTSNVVNERVKRVRMIGAGLPCRLGFIGWNANSGFAGLSLSLQMGAKEIYLIGFDMHRGKDGETNWHPNIKDLKGDPYKIMLNWQKNIDHDYHSYWANSVTIINANPDSHITIFRKCELMPLLEKREVIPCHTKIS